MGLVNVKELRPKIVEIRLNDPQTLNAMSEAMAQEFAAAVASISEMISKNRSSVRAVILASEGRAFSAGGHLEMLASKRKLSREQNKSKMLEFYSSFLCIRDLEAPTIAKIHGAAIGAGLCLACACDFRIAVEDAKLGFTFAKLALYPGMGATYLVPKLTGISRTLELLLSAKTIRAKEAYEIGLLTDVVPSDKLDERIGILTEELLTAGELTTRQLLATLRGSKADLNSALENEATCQAESYASSEYSAAIDRLLAKA